MIKNKRIIYSIFTFLISISSTYTSTAAPAGSITNVFCTANKSGNNVTVTAGGKYNATQNTKDYLINGFQIQLFNNGNQQLRSTGLVSISPTTTYDAVKSWVIPYKEANSLKNMKLDFYNGGAIKATTGLITCIWS